MNENNANFTPAAPNFKTLVRMSFQGLTNFPYIEEDFDALTNYGLLSKVVEYLNQVISNNNEQNDLMTNLYNAYVSLQDYVNNYFDNLDVQDEINNKLDEMVEAGTLQEIIADYLNSKAVFGFDNVASMKSSTNLINGSYAETLGYYSKNDGGTSLYKIRTITNEDIVNEENIIALADDTLIAELIIKNGVLNVKQFGAKGDNVTEDSTKLQDSIDYAESNNYSLYIPNGIYKISTTLNVTGCNIKGDGCKNSIIKINNCDGLTLHQYNSQHNCKITGFTITSDSLDTEHGGIVFTTSNEKARGYNLDNLYFYNLGCAIYMIDSFRSTIINCNMNRCLRAVWILEQVVQSTFTNIISNCDLDTSISSTRFNTNLARYNEDHSNIGFQIGNKNETNRPEGIKLNNVCCTAHEIGLYIHDILYCDVTQSEFDYCRKQGIIINSHEGNCTISNSWIATSSQTDEPIIDILTPSTTTKYKLNIINNSIVNVNGHANKIGIGCGITSNRYFKNCVNVLNNVIKNVTNSIPLKYGIYLNYVRYSSIIGNQSFDCETDIHFTIDKKGIINDNNVTTLEINSFAGSTLYAYANMYTTLTGTRGGTTVGDLS